MIRAVKCRVYEEQRNSFIRNAVKIADAKAGLEPYKAHPSHERWSANWNREFLNAMEELCRFHGLSCEVKREPR